MTTTGWVAPVDSDHSEAPSHDCDDPIHHTGDTMWTMAPRSQDNAGLSVLGLLVLLVDAGASLGWSRGPDRTPRALQPLAAKTPRPQRRRILHELCVLPGVRRSALGRPG